MLRNAKNRMQRCIHCRPATSPAKDVFTGRYRDCPGLKRGGRQGCCLPQWLRRIRQMSIICGVGRRACRRLSFLRHIIQAHVCERDSIYGVLSELTRAPTHLLSPFVPPALRKHNIAHIRERFSRRVASQISAEASSLECLPYRGDIP
jgi:hypothetical protein